MGEGRVKAIFYFSEKALNQQTRKKSCRSWCIKIPSFEEQRFAYAGHVIEINACRKSWNRKIPKD